MTSFCGVPAAFRTCKTAFQCLSAWVRPEPYFLAFECIRLLLNVLKWLLEWPPKILRALVFGNNLHQVMLPVFDLQTFLSDKKLLLFTLQMNDIYWKRRTMSVAFQRMFGTLERWNNNQVTPSLSKPHELSYRSNSSIKTHSYITNGLWFKYLIKKYEFYCLHIEKNGFFAISQKQELIK